MDTAVAKAKKSVNKRRIYAVVADFETRTAEIKTLKEGLEWAEEYDCHWQTARGVPALNIKGNTRVNELTTRGFVCGQDREYIYNRGLTRGEAEAIVAYVRRGGRTDGNKESANHLR